MGSCEPQAASAAAPADSMLDCDTLLPCRLCRRETPSALFCLCVAELCGLLACGEACTGLAAAADPGVVELGVVLARVLATTLPTCAYGSTRFPDSSALRASCLR